MPLIKVHERLPINFRIKLNSLSQTPLLSPSAFCHSDLISDPCILLVPYPQSGSDTLFLEAHEMFFQKSCLTPPSSVRFLGIRFHISVHISFITFDSFIYTFNNYGVTTLLH